MFSKLKSFSSAMGVAVLLAVCIAAPGRANVLVVQTLPATATSSDGLLTLTLSSSNPTGAVDVDTTYTWTVTNNSTTITLTGVVLGSHWGDYCINTSGPNCPVAPPQGPTLISLAPGCGSQSANEFETSIAFLGIWCTPGTGVTLAPGASVSGSVTVRPGTDGPALYTVYTSHTPLNGIGLGPLDPEIDYHGIVAPAATDVQISGAASTGSPLAGSDFTYTYQIKNAGPWGTYGGIIFTDTLPDSLTYFSSSVVEVDSPSGTPSTFTDLCSVVAQTVVCKLNDMTVGGAWNQAKVTLTVLAPSTAQPISNTATVHTISPQTDSNLNNNSVTVNVATK